MTDYAQYALWGIPFWAFLLDCLIGDPKSNLHPVVLIGRVISFFESIFYFKHDSNTKKLLFGALTVLAVLITVVGIGTGILLLFYMAGIWGHVIINTIFLYICITPRSLAEAGGEIAKLLRQRNIEQARVKLSWIVGRNTTELDEGEVTRGAVETIAENTVDGIISPLFFFILFGPLGALFYRTANTMDSMLGYKNSKYLFFGRTAARLDDVLNFVPARITFILLIISAFLLGKDAKKAYAIGMRDANKHPSPNGGYAEAPVAGALHIRLGGYNTYSDTVTFRAYMGDLLTPLRAMHISLTIRLMYTATLMMTLMAVCIGLLYQGGLS